ncbi:hypothetical protein JZU54_03045, partial [bacterium]|nr:hypothetical protein [bacterium]
PNVFAADGATATEQQTVWRRRAAQAAAQGALTQALTSAIRGLPNPPATTSEKSGLMLADGGSVALASWGSS